MAFDLPTGKVFCYLPLDDFRPEASGGDGWTEQDARKHYRDWALTRDEFGRPPVDPERNGAWAIAGGGSLENRRGDRRAPPSRQRPGHRPAK